MYVRVACEGELKWEGAFLSINNLSLLREAFGCFQRDIKRSYWASFLSK
jgi:hypothetical protein